MDRITKALKKLLPKERDVLKNLLTSLDSGQFNNLDIKKLKGRRDIYRVRKGKIRVIFRKTDNKIFILTIEKRSSKTYKNI